MNEPNKNLEEELITKFRKLTPEQQQQVLDFVEFLVWREQKRNSNFSGKSNMSEIETTIRRKPLRSRISIIIYQCLARESYYKVN